MNTTRYSAFSADALIATGDAGIALAQIKQWLDAHPGETALIFDDESGRQVDFDFRGSPEEALARILPAQTKPGRGRPSLGVVCGEVSLLTRHWEWLEAERHNISATIRRLVDEAMKREPAQAKRARLVEAIDKKLWVVAGNKASCEEASRALYAGDCDRFKKLIAGWPKDIAAHFSALADELDGFRY
ncbi:MAG TPA: DUF2239 domain-containing protein [Spirochaetaceae bacterium]|nr:DUF2239 domain-containing protein [Spirochaetaceae bacterium]